ncbi:MAG: 23S rRNA (guanosine(2251)-2'-O)-methyltransferase RlmB [Legionellaceae bacterium]|nr:23S rRNA (guanosine(2251)-2'-O)-methyltransferase RlmB [Legionellaceae bacterium]|tara:strand:- start:1228 stop:1965 length:738 start_codon:yes stop_codon:yes gene_type:complete
MKNIHYIYGWHAVLAILKQRPENVTTVFLLQQREDDRAQQLFALTQSARISVQAVSKQVLDKKSHGENHQGVVAECRSQDVLNENDLVKLLDDLHEDPYLLILDGVQDPHNLGACLRSADAAGVHAVIIPKDKSVGITPIVRKVSCGASEVVPIVQATNLARVMKMLKSRNIWLFGADDKAEQSLYQADLKGAVALVMGAEGAGMRRLTREHCDVLISIPMHGSVSSLNVSVATGICLFEALRQR